MKNLSWAWVPQTNFFKYNLLEKLGWVPQSKFMHLCQFWDMFVIISILPSTFLVTYQSIFDSSVAWQWAIVYTGDFIYVIAMGLRFFRSYVTDRGEWITDREKIVFHYLRTYFFLDLFSVMPFEIFTFLGDITDKTFTLAMWRLNRYIRLYRVWMFLYKREKELGTSTLLFMTFRFIFICAVSVHNMAGLWYAIACQNKALVNDGDEICKSESWAGHQNIDWETASEFQKYIVSLYWSVTTLTTVGYGDITPKTYTEKWVSVVCMLWGVTLFGYILGGLASMLTNADAQRSQYIHRLNVIRKELLDAQVGHDLKKRVIGYYEYLWRKNRGKSVNELISKLPPELKTELSIDSHMQILKKSSLFRDYPDEFLHMVSLISKRRVYLPHQVIVHKINKGSHIYIIQMGEAEVIESPSSHLLAILRQGDIFGEDELVAKARYTKLLKSRTHCGMLVIPIDGLLDILQDFPGIKANLKHNIKKRHLGSSKREESFKDVEHLPVEKGSHIKRSKLVQSFIDSISPSLMPGSKFAIIWDLLVVCIAIGIAWIYSYQGAFTHFKPIVGYTASEHGKLLLIFTYFLDSVLFVDIFISMKKAVRTPTELITNPCTLLIRYLTSIWFVLDMLAILPLEMFGLIWHNSGNEWKYIPLLRLNRLLKLWKVVAFFEDIEGSLHISVAYVSLVKFIIYIFTVTHISACIWFPLACFQEKNCLSSSWANSHGITEHTSPWHDYLISVYWSTATMTTVGYGDISAYNTQEMVISLIVQLVGVMLYGYCLGALTAIITNVSIPRVSFQEKMQAIHQFMSEHNIGKGLSDRVESYCILLWGHYRGEGFPGGERLLHDLPKRLQEDVSMKRCGSLLKKMPLFAFTGDPAFVRQISVVTSFYFFAPGDIVIYGGDLGREMYVIREGYVEILSEDLNQVISVLGPGRYFGDIGFLFGAPSEYTFRVATQCKLVVIKRCDVEKIIVHFPLVLDRFEVISSDDNNLMNAQAALLISSQEVDNSAECSARHSITSALALTMNTPLSIVTKSSMSSAVAACADGLHAQSKITGPISVGNSQTKIMVRHSREELTEMLGTDHDGPKTEGPELDDECKKKDSRSPTLVKHIDYLQKTLSYCFVPYVIIPDSAFCYWWEIISVIFALLITFTISLQAAFVHSNPILWSVNYLLDLFFLVDMVLKMYTAYYDKNGDLITKSTSCAARYLKTKFLIDCISSFPTDLIVLTAWTKNISDILRVLSLARINRLLKIYKVPLAFNALEKQITRSIGPIKALKFSIYMFLGTHLAACIWFLLACASLTISTYNPHVCEVESWAFHYSHTPPLTYYSIFHQYMVSLYWATATTTTVGYGDIRAHTNSERLYASIVMVLGVSAYGYIIASVAASLANADARRAKYQSKMKSIKAYLKDHKIDKALRKRVMRFYEHMWDRYKGLSFASLFQELPVALQADVSLCLYKPVLDRVTLFENTELGFIKLLALSIKPLTFISNEYIIKKGDIGDEIFLIHRGIVEVVSEDGKIVFAVLKKGDFFGEISLVFDIPRTLSVRAATNCDLFVLNKDDLDSILSYYPNIWEQMEKVAEERIKVMKRRKTSVQALIELSREAEKDSNAQNGYGIYTYLRSTIQYRKWKKSQGGFSIKKRVSPFLFLIRCVWSFLEHSCSFIIPRDSTVGLALYWSGCWFSYYSFFTISYQTFFQNNSSFWWIVNYMFEFYFLIEIFLKFHLTYRNQRGEVVSDSYSIALHYLKDPRGFFLDCATIFPYELLVLPIPDRTLRTAMLLYIRTPHLLRVIRLKWFFDSEQKRLNQRTIPLQILKSSVLVFLSTHLVACIWYFLACRAGTCYENSWAYKHSLFGTEFSYFTHYGTSMYWAVTTMTTVGYGDLTATNLVEMVYVTGVMVGGKIIFGFIIGTIASTLANLETERVLFESKLNALKVYMKNLFVSKPMRRSVFKYLELVWLNNMGATQQNILSDLPYTLQADVSLAITHHMLTSVHIFKDADTTFLRHLVLFLTPRLYSQGDYIGQRKGVWHTIFLLYRGKVSLWDQTLNKETANKGKLLGLESLLFCVPVDFTARALTNVEVFTLKRSDFISVLKAHPKTATEIQNVALKEYGLPIELKL